VISVNSVAIHKKKQWFATEHTEDTEVKYPYRRNSCSDKRKKWKKYSTELTGLSSFCYILYNYLVIILWKNVFLTQAANCVLQYSYVLWLSRLILFLSESQIPMIEMMNYDEHNPSSSLRQTILIFLPLFSVISVNSVAIYLKNNDLPQSTQSTPSENTWTADIPVLTKEKKQIDRIDKVIVILLYTI